MFATSRRTEQLNLRSQQRVVATVEESVLKTEMAGLESQEEDAPKRLLFFKPMSWLGQIRSHRRDESWSASLANPTVMVIQNLGEKSIQTNRDKSDVLRHIIKNVSKRLFRLIESRTVVTQPDFFFSKIGGVVWRHPRMMSMKTLFRPLLDHHDRGITSH
jgi:hypothetical protein